jgi:hypothetical protein
MHPALHSIAYHVLVLMNPTRSRPQAHYRLLASCRPIVRRLGLVLHRHSPSCTPRNPRANTEQHSGQICSLFVIGAQREYWSNTTYVASSCFCYRDMVNFESSPETKAFSTSTVFLPTANSHRNVPYAILVWAYRQWVEVLQRFDSALS